MTSLSIPLPPSSTRAIRLLILLLLHLLLFVIPVALSSPTPPHVPDDYVNHPDCKALPRVDARNLRHMDYLLSKSLPSSSSSSSTSRFTPFDDDDSDFDIFLRLAHDSGLNASLLAYGQVTTLFLPTDRAMIQSAMDLQVFLSSFNPNKPTLPTPPGNKPYYSQDKELTLSEAEAYNVIKTFSRQFRFPRLVLTSLLRDHIVSASLSICEYMQAYSWTSWGNSTIVRRGTALDIDSPFFLSAYLQLMKSAVRTAEGVIQDVDRMIITDIRKFQLKPTPSPSPTMSATPSPSGSPGESERPRPSASVTPTVSKSVSPMPSVPPPPAPALSDAVQPFPTPSEAYGGGGNSNNNNGVSGSAKSANGTECFPGVAQVRTRDRGSVPMAEVRIGDVVQTSLGWSAVFMFSHRSAAEVTEMIRIGRYGGKSVSLSKGHYVIVEGSAGRRRLKVAEEVRVDDWVFVVSHDDVDGGDDGGRLVRERVTSVVTVGGMRGLYAPHTYVGDVVVDGVLASCYTKAIKPVGAHSMLAPMRALGRALRTRADVCMGAFDGGSEGWGGVVRISLVRGVQRLTGSSLTSLK